MAPRRPRDIGTAAETAVVRYLRDHGFPHAERRALRGARDAGDITGIPGVCWSIKGGEAAKDASDGLVEDWLSELERQRLNAKASYGVLVLQRRGYGPDRAGRWWAIMPGWQYEILCNRYSPRWEFGDVGPLRMHLWQVCALLVYAGYGTEVDT